MQELAKVERHLQNRRESLGLLLEAWPEQARIADFKGQTPLMMAANHGDAQLVEVLAPLSDIDAQDYLGRTPLHAAVAGRSSACLGTVLAQNPDVAKVSHGEANTVAHTAARFGWVEGLRLILNEFPRLAEAKNTQAQTPKEMAQELLENYEVWQTFMREQKNRSIGTRGDFESIFTLLEERCIH